MSATAKARLIAVREQLACARRALQKIADGDTRSLSPSGVAAMALENIEYIEMTELQTLGNAKP